MLLTCLAERAKNARAKEVERLLQDLNLQIAVIQSTDSPAPVNRISRRRRKSNSNSNRTDSDKQRYGSDRHRKAFLPTVMAGASSQNVNEVKSTTSRLRDISRREFQGSSRNPGPSPLKRSSRLSLDIRDLPLTTNIKEVKAVDYVQDRQLVALEIDDTGEDMYARLIRK